MRTVKSVNTFDVWVLGLLLIVRMINRSYETKSNILQYPFASFVGLPSRERKYSGPK
jgi:hypothetical protein